jgi:ADP-ribose pyrophosphatase
MANDEASGGANGGAGDTPGSVFGAGDVEVAAIETPFSGYFRVDRYRFRHRLFAGGWSGILVREVFERGHAVVLLPYDPVADTVVLIEQLRIGAYTALNAPWLGAGRSPWLIELVAGIIDDGETADQVARREAVEETGRPVDHIEEIARYLTSPGGSSETIVLYVGRVDSAGAGGIHGLDHEGEDIRVLVVPSTEVFRWLDERRIVNGQALIGLQWLRLHRDALRARWLAVD